MIFSRASDLIRPQRRHTTSACATSRASREERRVITIDEEPGKIGRWPWSRDVLAKMTDQLAAAAKVIANTILLSDPRSTRLQYIVKLLDLARSRRSRCRGAWRRRQLPRQPRGTRRWTARSSRC
jgi:serine/threonine-protein kinase